MRLAAPLAIYVPRATGQPAPSFRLGELRMVLSADGQPIVAGQAGGALGAVPLSPSNLALEREKVDAL